jgi:hydrogenase 3 maturation protease
MHSDDAAGMLVARKLENISPRSKKGIRSKVFFGHTAPENLTGQIKKFKPTHIIILDAVDMRKKPGEAYCVDFTQESGISFSTHRLPVKLLSDYLGQCLSCQVLLLGIQPKCLTFGQPISPEVKASCQKLAVLLGESLNLC